MGVEYLASSLRTARQGQERSLTVAAGDIVGASPLLSGLFHDEPTVEAMNKLGLDVTGVGNHEFDEGKDELLRLQNGGCHPVEGCYEKGRTFKGADYPILSANVVNEKTGRPLLKPYTIENVKGVRVGFIGVTLEGTPNIVTAEGVKGLKFLDEVETINKYTKELKGKGVNAVVALVHEGGFPASSAYNYDCDSRRLGHRSVRPDRRHRQAHLGRRRRAGHRPHPQRVRLHHPRPQGQRPPGHQRGVLRPSSSPSWT